MKLPTEHAEQVAVVRWLRAEAVPFFAVPNGAKVSVRERAKLKAEGLSRGVPDLMLPCHKVALEMKARGSGRLSAHQKEWRDILESNGWKFLVAHGAKDAIEQLRKVLR